MNSINTQARAVSDDTAPNALIELLGRDGFILYSRDVAHRLGYKAALILGHAMYWSRYLVKNAPQRGGWFFMTSAQWERATGLSKHEQTVARDTLKDVGLLAEKLARRSNHLHYHVNLGAFAQMVGIDLEGRSGERGRWRALESWLHGAIAYYRPLVDACGSVSAALYMSYLLHQHRSAVQRDRVDEGWLSVRQADVRRALCLGTKSQRNARARLVDGGLIAESYGRVAIQFDALARALAPITDGTSSPGSAIEPGYRQAADQEHYEPVSHHVVGPSIAPLPLQARLDLQRSEDHAPVDVAASLDPPSENLSTNSVDKSSETGGVVKKGQVVDTSEVAPFEPPTCPFSTTNLPFFNHPISIGINKTTTTARARLGAAAPQRRPATGRPMRRRRSDDFEKPMLVAKGGQRLSQEGEAASQLPHEMLELPDKLEASWHAAVRQTLHAAPVKRRQILLDELAGQMTVKEIKNPAGYLHALVQRDAAGTLILAMADAVAKTRKRRKQHEERLRNAMSGPSATKRDNTVAREKADKAVQASEVATVARAQLQELRKKFAAGGAR